MQQGLIRSTALRNEQAALLGAVHRDHYLDELCETRSESWFGGHQYAHETLLARGMIGQCVAAFEIFLTLLVAETTGDDVQPYREVRTPRWGDLRGSVLLATGVDLDTEAPVVAAREERHLAAHRLLDPMTVLDGSETLKLAGVEQHLEALHECALRLDEALRHAASSPA